MQQLENLDSSVFGEITVCIEGLRKVKVNNLQGASVKAVITVVGIYLYGQTFTFDPDYYEAAYRAADNTVLVRRRK